MCLFALPDFWVMSPSISPTNVSNVPHRVSAFQTQLSPQTTLHPQQLVSFEHHTSHSFLAVNASSRFSSVGEFSGEGMGIILRGLNSFKRTLSSSELEWQYRPFGMRENPKLN